MKYQCTSLILCLAVVGAICQPIAAQSKSNGNDFFNNVRNHPQNGNWGRAVQNISQQNVPGSGSQFKLPPKPPIDPPIVEPPPPTCPGTGRPVNPPIPFPVVTPPIVIPSPPVIMPTPPSITPTPGGTVPIVAPLTPPVVAPITYSGYVWLPQPKTGEDANLCAYYALHHYLNGMDRELFKQIATDFYQDQLPLSREEATRLVSDGNDPGVLQAFGLKELGSAGWAKDAVIVADTSAGHFYTVRNIGDSWWSFDTYNLARPQKLGSASHGAPNVSGQIWARP